MVKGSFYSSVVREKACFLFSNIELAIYLRPWIISINFWISVKHNSVHTEWYRPHHLRESCEVSLVNIIIACRIASVLLLWREILSGFSGNLTIFSMINKWKFIKIWWGYFHELVVQFIEQVAQLSQRDRAAGWVSNGQKWKTGTERQYLRTI